MSSYVENEAGAGFDFDIKEVFDEGAKEILDREGCPYETQVNLLITDNAGIREYNRQYRQIDAPTDVLSFPMIPFERESDFGVVEKAQADYFDPESGELILGDIIISADKVTEQADAFGHSPKREFAFLCAHSLLHLCGYDHMQQDKAAVMERKQEEVLQHLSITREEM